MSKLPYNLNTGRSALPLLYNPVHFTLGSFFSHEVLHKVLVFGIVILITLGWYCLGIYGRMFKVKVPEYFNMKNWYVVISMVLVYVFSKLCSGFEFILNALLSFLMVRFWLSQGEITGREVVQEVQSKEVLEVQEKEYAEIAGEITGEAVTSG